MIIEEPDWHTLTNVLDVKKDDLRAWFQNNVAPINKMLSEGVEVYGQGHGQSHGQDQGSNYE